MPIIGIQASAISGNLKTSAYHSIATATGNGSASALTISGIDQSYTHLRIIASLRANPSSNRLDAYLQLNNDSTANYSFRWMYGSGDTNIPVNASNSQTAIALSYMPGSSATSDNYGLFIIDIPDYSSANKYKGVGIFTGYNNRSASNENNIANIAAVYKANTNAITEVKISGSAFTSLSKMSIYGLKG
jgi:hypothetical protein